MAASEAVAPHAGDARFVRCRAVVDASGLLLASGALIGTIVRSPMLALGSLAALAAWSLAGST